MLRLQSSTLALIIAILLCGTANAQENNSTAKNTQDPNSALRQKAFDLLESLANQIDTLQSGENRARIGSNIAGSLWVHDEKRARTLLLSVEEDVKAGLQSSRSDDPRRYQDFLVFLQLRQDTVERIAKHDAELALAFLKATEASSDKRVPYRYGGEERERAFELRLAKEIAANNPDLALKLGRQSLARGISNDLLPVMKQLSRKHKDHALLLYKEIVAQLRNADLQNWATMSLAQALAVSFRPPLVDDSTFRDLINLFITKALASGCGNKVANDGREYFCRQFGSLVSEMEKVDPVRAAQLKHWPADGQDIMSREAYNELGEVSQNGTVDEVLALAVKYPQIEGDIYARAMEMAQASGDLERARRLATEYSGDPEKRARLLAQVERYQTWASMSEEKIADLQRQLSTLRTPSQRLDFLVSNSIHIGASDQKTALRLLNQAYGIAESMPPGKDQAGIQMGLAMLYCFEKSDRGFAIMESVLPKLNELVAAGAKLDGYDTHYLRDGEWNMTGEGELGSLLTSLAQNAGYFAWCDFDRAVTLAAQFERAEIRMMAQLKLAQAILAGPPKRSQMPRGY